jgi:putative membrane protein
MKTGYGWIVRMMCVVFLVSIVIKSSSQGIDDTSFIQKNITDNLAEIEMARMAQQRAADQQIKRAASQLVADHTAILNDLRRVARKRNIIEVVAATKKQNLDQVSGVEFEKQWLGEMIATHQSKITELENASAHITDAEVKAIVSKALEKMRMHKDMLTRIKYKFPE